MTTPTGIPITACPVCGVEHPVTRQHCQRCGRASAFIRDGQCLMCAREGQR